ncbi:MAG: DsbA family protein, partial [Mesorhizobium sp.]
ALYQVKRRVTEAVVLKAAAEAGLDVERLKTDMESPEIKASIGRNLQLAQALNINGTPGFVAGKQILHGATDLATLMQAIEQARKEE